MTISPHKQKLILTGIVLIGLSILYNRFDRPRVLAVNEVPIAFWSWRTQAPSAEDVQAAFAATNARTLFLRAGQFDSVDGRVQRIRPVSGAIPAQVELHLVYNSTRRFLNGFESLAVDHIATAVLSTFASDLERAAKDRGGVVGLQLDLDIPTRLLPKYAELLKIIREHLPSGSDLSITGLPTWATAAEIEGVLDNVDFWIPQFYGGKIPMHVDQRTPISSPVDVARSVANARRLGKPFFAGIAAYSYAIVYGTDGDLIELRGDIDPARAAAHASLDLVGLEAASGDRSEARYEYRANSDLILDGLIVRKGQILVFDVPSSSSLRESARVVRANAGPTLLGICLFRLPTTGDRTTLNVEEIAVALQDSKARVETRLALEQISDRQLKLTARNIGSADTAFEDGAMTIDLSIRPGAITRIHYLDVFSGFDTICTENGAECSSTRADLLRLRVSAWRPGDRASVILTLNQKPVDRYRASVITRVNDGRMNAETFEVKLER